MTAITFDTLAYSKTLQAAGMPAEQADALAKAQKAAIDEMVAAKELASKDDLHIALAEQKHEILKWMMGMVVAQTALIIAAIAFIK